MRIICEEKEEFSVAFIDLLEAYDRDALWKVLQIYGFGRKHWVEVVSRKCRLEPLQTLYESCPLKGQEAAMEFTRYGETIIMATPLREFQVGTGFRDIDR